MENKSSLQQSFQYPKIKNAIFLCLLLLGIQMAAGLILGFTLSVFGIGTEHLLYGIGLIIISLLGFGITILIGYKKTGKSFKEAFFVNNVSVKTWIAVIIFMFGFVIISSELDNLLNFILPMPEAMQDVFNSLLANDYFIISVILIGIIPAIVEEMLFRGVIFYGFKENYSEKKAILISALLFGLIHLNPWQFVTGFIFGIIAAYLCIKTKSIFPGVYMHFFNNMLGVILTKYGGLFPIPGFSSQEGHSFQPLWFTAAGVALAGIGVLIYLNALKSSSNE